VALNIKDVETDRLARELAAETGESITVAARRAIEERLLRVRAQRKVASVEEDLRALVMRGRQRPALDERSADEIVGYDDLGLPR